MLRPLRVCEVSLATKMYGKSTTVETLKEASEACPLRTGRRLPVLNGLERDEWDKQMACGFSSGGRGYGAVERVRREVDKGKAEPLRKGTGRTRRNMPSQ